ncbi:hypothetical protein [Nocardioides sp. B-3]|uniref:hypothetical protein n=1 Tax=Nocardioides sp. B-3 TaxID=2895565 RepID=UPI0021532095|nr:hypothetical protein [Nocardioides sp. B-3]UUZ58025.1 hypothetical protein LP418_17100 [Nocardioides sp. B-3]
MIGDIVDKANWAAGKLEDAASGVIAGLGRPVPGESEAEKAIKKWNDELQPEIQKGVNEVAQKVTDAVSDLTGNPVELIDYSKKFIAAKSTLYQQNTLMQDITNLGNTWEGAAYNSYATVAGEQNDALLALANNLQSGGDLTRDGADQILQLWLDLITNFLDYATQAISVIGSCADVGKALGAWISTIADAFALIIQKIGDVAILLGTFWKNQITLGLGELGAADGRLRWVGQQPVAQDQRIVQRQHEQPRELAEQVAGRSDSPHALPGRRVDCGVQLMRSEIRS